MRDRRLWLTLFSLFVVLTALGAYYYVHKPITLPLAAALGSALLDLLAALLLAALGGAVGRRCLASLAPLGSPGERAAVDAAVGFGVMGLALFALGIVHLYYAPVMGVLVIAALAWLRREARTWLADVRHALREIWLPDRLSRFSGAFVWLTLGLGLLRALAPPLMWDALAYHLALPQHYAQSHALGLASENIFSGMPQLTEMLFTAATLLRGSLAAQTLGWVFGALLALGLAAHAHHTLGNRFGALTPAILFSAYSIALELSWAYADLLLMLLALAMWIVVREWRRDGDGRWLLWAGALAGFAVSCKYTGVLVPLAGAAVIISHQSSVAGSQTAEGGQRPAVFRLQSSVTGRLSLFVIPAFAVFLPWFLKNWLATGSPVFPLLFPTSLMNGLRQQFYSRPDLIDSNPLWTALLYLRAVFLGVQGGNNYEATLGPLWIILPVLLALGWRGLPARTRRELRPLTLFAAAAYAGWVGLALLSSLGTQARLFFPIFPALALVCAGGLAAAETLDTPALRGSFVARAAVVLLLGLALVENLMNFVARSPLPYLLGQQSAAAYRAANLGWYAVALERVNALPEPARVAFLWESRSLDCAPQRCDPDEIIDEWWYRRHTLASPEAILARWKSESFTHALIYEAGLQFVRADPRSGFTPQDWAALDALRGQLRLVENIGGAYSLYALP